MSLVIINDCFTDDHVIKGNLETFEDGWQERTHARVLTERAKSRSIASSKSHIGAILLSFELLYINRLSQKAS